MTSKSSSPSFWDDPEKLDFFRSLPPDRLLLRYLRRRKRPDKIRALDLGCATGRNTVELVRTGADTFAVDISERIVKFTRRELKKLLPSGERKKRVLVADWKKLPFPENRFNLVVAIGVLHVGMQSDAEIFATLEEIRRVLEPGGHVIVQIFSNRMIPSPRQKVPGNRFIYRLEDGRCVSRFSKQEVLSLMKKISLAPQKGFGVRTGGDALAPRISYSGIFKSK